MARYCILSDGSGRALSEGEELPPGAYEVPKGSLVPPLPKAPPKKVGSDDHMPEGLRAKPLRPGEHAGNTGTDYVPPPTKPTNTINRLIQQHIYYDSTGRLVKKP